jgi:sialic acid synthase SpsE
MLKNLETSRNDQIKISDYCKKKRIMFLSTPYDKESADFLDKVIDVPMFKLASIELNNHIFIRYIAKKGKPFLLSTGLSTMDDVRNVVKIAKKEGFVDRMILLQCTSDYPAKTKYLNLNVLKTYMKEFPDMLFGFSDHSSTDIASVGAVAIGAAIVEKHFTLDKSFKGPDHSSSLDVDGLKEWVAHIREIEASMGSYEKKITKAEKGNKSMRKYLVITPQKRGTIIQENMLRTMRTGEGVLPIDKNLKDIVGKKLKKEIKKSKPFSWDMIK